MRPPVRGEFSIKRFGSALLKVMHLWTIGEQENQRIQETDLLRQISPGGLSLLTRQWFAR